MLCQRRPGPRLRRRLACVGMASSLSVYQCPPLLHLRTADLTFLLDALVSSRTYEKVHTYLMQTRDSGKPSMYRIIRDSLNDFRAQPAQRKYRLPLVTF
jgi:hypothetical protein